MYGERNDWAGDQHRRNPRVHYRLYVAPRSGEPVVICVQDFDYVDYDARRILSPEAWDTESDAEQALLGLLPTIEASGSRVPATMEPGLRARLLAQAVRQAAASDITA